MTVLRWLAVAVGLWLAVNAVILGTLWILYVLEERAERRAR